MKAEGGRLWKADDFYFLFLFAMVISCIFSIFHFPFEILAFVISIWHLIWHLSFWDARTKNPCQMTDRKLSQ